MIEQFGFTSPREVIAALFLLSGLVFFVGSAIGMLRLPDFYSRIHASGNSETLGCTLSFIGLMIYEGPTLTAAKMAFVFLLVFILVVAMFFFFNPEVINGKNVYYTCSKSYDHEKLPASVIENVELEFNGHGTIIDIKVKSDYIFNDVNYYKEFRDKSYFYQYFSDGDTYKFDDNTYTYKLFSSINTKEDFFLPTDKDGLIKHYQDDNYTCKVVDN